MKPDEFEQRLRRQPLQSIPPDWREEVLLLASRAATPPVTRAKGSPLRHWLREWLWPSPVAWSALAACWVAILVLTRAAQPSASELAEARANARLALAHQALVRDYAMSESGRNTRPLSPPGRAPGRPDQSQARPSLSDTWAAAARSERPADAEGPGERPERNRPDDGTRARETESENLYPSGSIRG